ncbi:MAG: hypothetical protein H5T92_07780 [Synergistales bacterium]|nr:hypothetical protein [Synergistales bacterium]
MTEGTLSRRIVADRIHGIQEMMAEIRLLPLESREAFFADRRNPWAAESCLRRAFISTIE